MTIQEENFNNNEEEDTNDNLGWLDEERSRFITERKKDAETRPSVKRISKQTPDVPIGRTS